MRALAAETRAWRLPHRNRSQTAARPCASWEEGTRGDTCRRLEAEGSCRVARSLSWKRRPLGQASGARRARARGWMRKWSGRRAANESGQMSGEGDYNFRRWRFGGSPTLLPGARTPRPRVGPRRTWLGPSRPRPGARPGRRPR